MWMQERRLVPNKDSHHEEVAPCYTCNLEAYDQIRYRGFRPLDPAQAERLHTG
jgi:hypothetical protein